MELLQLRYFVDACELENFSAVARKNLVPQPSISKTISKLELELGTSLFDRQGKKIQLNENGRYFYEKIKIALNSIDEGIQHFSEPTPSNITIYIQAGNRYIPLLIADFLSSTKNIFVSTVNRASINMDNLYDFTFMQVLDNMNPYKYETLLKDEIIAIIPINNPLSNNSSVSIKDLANEDFIGYYPSMNLRSFTDNYCDSHGFKPNVVFETHDYTALRYMVEKGRGISLMPKKFFELQGSDKFKVVSLKEKTYRTVCIAWNNKKILSQDEKLFLDYTKNWFSNF